MPAIFERVILLKNVDLFRETPEPVLSRVAKALEEIHAPTGTKIIEKGEMGTCLYIIVEGRVKVQDGDHVLAELGSRQVVGELALLDPEPRSASVIAIEETTLLKLDWEAFYDLMVDNIEIARGAIATLCRRIRKQNELLAQIQAEHKLELSEI
jgi:CRP-like cAMP-binding protein